MIDSNNQLKTLSKSLLNAVRNVMEAKKDAGEPMTAKQKELAAKAPPHDKITHADVLVGRGVLKKHPTTGKLVTNEEAEQIDELSQDKLMQYRSAAKKQGTGIQDKMKIGGGDWSKDGKDTSTLKKRMAGYKMAGRKTNPDLAASVGKAPRVAATEEVQIDEISSGLAQRYLQKKRERDYNTSADGMTHTLKKPTTLNRLNRDIKGTVRALKTVEKAKKTNEEVELDEALDAAARYGQHHVAIKELMKSITQHVEAHKSDALKHRDYRGKKGVNWGHVGDVAQVHSQLADIHDRLAQQGEYKKGMNESLDEKMSDEAKTAIRGAVKAGAKARPLVSLASKFGKKETNEEAELDEARGRPRKNPLPPGQEAEPEPRQHIMQQLQRAKLSMRGGEDVMFKDGKKAHVSGAHASKILTRYAGMKPSDKEDFQKKISASHEAFKEHL